MSSKCPKCGGKIKATYMKQTCPHCGVNLLYYKLDEQLEADAARAAAEVAKVEQFKDTLRRSTVATPWHIVRLVLFFTPLLSMCLPMYTAGHKSVSLIGFILSIVNHGLDIAAWSRDYLFAVLAMLLVIVLSLAVIISALFSAARRGFRRNAIGSLINTVVFGVLSALVCVNGGAVRIGFYMAMLIYAAESILHYILAKPKTKRRQTVLVILLIPCLLSGIFCAAWPQKDTDAAAIPPTSAAIRVISYNTAAPWGTPFDDTASQDRVIRFAETIDRCQPDLIGTQELNTDWLTALTDSLTDYESYAVKRGGDETEERSEMNGLFWNRSRFRALETDTFWLSDTPNTESRYTYTDADGKPQEAGCNRICSYAILEQQESGHILAFFNTHLDNASEEARQFGAALILDRIAQIRERYGSCTIVLTGDFNQARDSAAYQTVTSVLQDTTDWTKAQATWQDWGYTDTGNEPIDFIFTDGKAVAYTVLDDRSEGYTSDHYGIMSDIDY